MKKLKGGISLIVLIITIIVVIILAGVVILSLQKNNPIKQASKAKFLNDVETFKEDLELYKQKQYIKNNGQFDSETLNAPVEGLDIYDVIPSLENSSYGKNDFKVEKGKLIYQGTNKDYQDWSKDAGIDTGNNTQEVNGPVLTKGMTPIKWNGTTLATTTTDDTNWYSYTTANKQWANAQTADGSMWVWIPRYEYKIASLYHQSSNIGGEIDIKFIQTSQTTADSGYIIEPAFIFGDIQLSGIWVAKFEATAREGVDNYTNTDNVITKHVKVIPGVQSWRYSYISTMFDVCRNMEKDSTYGWTTDGINAKNIDTHLMKNVEWGACAYLAQSSYGKNSEVWINPYYDGSIKTGQAGTNVNVSATASTYSYNDTTYGVNASTTGNVYGIYDMSGGSWERVAAYINNDNNDLTKYGNSLVSADAKYKDVYAKGSNDDYETNYNANSSKIGDAIYETSSSGYGDSWYSDNTFMPYSDTPFLLRGGNCCNSSDAGLFYLSSSERLRRRRIRVSSGCGC